MNFFWRTKEEKRKMIYLKSTNLINKFIIHIKIAQSKRQFPLTLGGQINTNPLLDNEM